MHRQELSKIVNFVHFYEWAPIGDVCLMISKKVQHDHRPLRASFPPAIPLSKHPYPYLYLQICVSIVRSRTSLLSAKLIIGKSLPAQLLAPHMCEIKRKFHLGKTKNVSFFLSFRVLSSMYNAHMYMAGKWSLAGGKIPTTHKVHRQICIGKRIPKKWGPAEGKIKCYVSIFRLTTWQLSKEFGKYFVSPRTESLRLQGFPTDID